ncbi:unnamed protein product [Vitrella brassicaformis CCMP3155]|uniref:Uncharacterized protein n=1 Tax=Vitrella brassicaformis (strain CCMP3155) TaxID=1169540 RepID=A0A0G4EKI0_VITBC|nr:unnamed protein product [Vitrella brassicaformis CCMP3155]|mmetsp:Transcript_54013/g.135781  ORF Transcript_54013/g.135781 Transcript_54013/m.135781 type:complete len:94 (+) Transcript_54013:160-441(+)|eukprot:CEL97066.1 unnamed protein product [Vitrella brassicaformis CCMP3155]
MGIGTLDEAEVVHGMAAVVVTRVFRHFRRQRLIQAIIRLVALRRACVKIQKVWRGYDARRCHGSSTRRCQQPGPPPAAADGGDTATQQQQVTC